MKWQIMLFNSDTRWALNMKINDWKSHFPPFCETSSCCLYTLEQQEWNIYLGSLDWYFFFFFGGALVGQTSCQETVAHLQFKQILYKKRAAHKWP